MTNALNVSVVLSNLHHPLLSCFTRLHWLQHPQVLLAKHGGRMRWTGQRTPEGERVWLGSKTHRGSCSDCSLLRRPHPERKLLQQHANVLHPCVRRNRVSALTRLLCGHDVLGNGDSVLRAAGPVHHPPPALHGEVDVSVSHHRPLVDAQDWTQKGLCSKLLFRSSTNIQ